MDADLTVSAAITIPERELSWRFSRSGGPGGQGVNTTDSRVELRWNPTTSVALTPVFHERIQSRVAGRLPDGTIAIVASEYRSQTRNRQAALARLAALVREATAPPAPPRRPTRPSKAARRRRAEDKIRRSRVKRLRRPGSE